MYARATDGSKLNNNRFSSCSISAMKVILEVKARGTDGCFVGMYVLMCFFVLSHLHLVVFIQRGIVFNKLINFQY